MCFEVCANLCAFLVSKSARCAGMFKCPNGTCLTKDKICDYNADCSEGEDEAGCPPKVIIYVVFEYKTFILSSFAERYSLSKRTIRVP